jgi:hypothetical protein
VGGGGVRMCGRWQLFSSESNVTNTIKTILQDFKEIMGQKGISKIYIIEIASICGGTGCGTFIDIPYIVRGTMKQLGLDENFTEFYAFLELPDSKIHSTNNINEERSRANAYAALKELQYFMREDTEYSVKFIDSEYKSNSRIFKQCFLLSNWAIGFDTKIPYNRNPLGETKKNTYLDGAVPEASNIILSRQREEFYHGGIKYFGFDVEMSNINGEGFKPDNKGKELIASTFGASKIEVPLVEITLAVFNRLFMELSDHWNRLNNIELINSILPKIISSFNVNGLYETMTGILDFESFTDDELKDKDLFNDVKAKLNSIEVKLSKNTGKFLERIREEIDKIYDTCGPFVTLKVLEPDVYRRSLDDEVLRLKKEKNSEKKDDAFVRQAVAGYNNFDTGFFGIKKGKKLQMREELIETLNSQSNTFAAFEGILKKRCDLIEEEIHKKIFDRVTKMIEELTDILKSVTNIDSFSFRNKVADGEVFSWNFSDVPYDLIHKKIDCMFTKKLSIKEPGSSAVRYETVDGKLFKIEGGMEKEEIFSLFPQKKGVTVKNKNRTIDNVIAVNEMLRLNGVETKEVDISEQLKKFLNDVKNTEVNDIFDLMLKDFSEIIEALAKESFKDLIVMYSPNWDFSVPLTGLKEYDKKQKFMEAIQKFKEFALPSFPVISDKIDTLVKTRHFSVTLEPEFDDEYRTTIDAVRDKIIKSAETQRITRKKIPMMITVNFYFDYGLSWYQDLEKCREAYKKLRGAGKTLHLAEGENEDWRKLPEIE